ncbi:Piezo-type mechanosensitive ion channel component 2 [Rhynchospora pubera]|uniref:Piezo-type mechanosensitive ion channel component 2 n=1 Tax=Rhynchospora pubera TaxID=906938 RepID=A0AAV8FL53_9POAL|nr:Piezo-type mechanosensitive ion channel component 2 [Rhynchospora pubera]
MGRSESDWNNCRKHPKHKNSTGVCPYCLRERLVHLSSPSISSFLNLACSTSASSTAYYSSESDLSSLAESPVHDKIQKVKLLLKDDIQLGDELPMTKRGEALLKSRSLVHVTRIRNELLEHEDRRKVKVERGKKEKMEDDKEDKKEKKTRFWTKILKGGFRREERAGEKSWALGHSRTLKERTAAKWVPFA